MTIQKEPATLTIASSTPFATSSHALKPISMIAANVAIKITASIERRPCSDQYTSLRLSHSANSSSASPVPIPNRTARYSCHGDSGEIAISR